MKQLVLHSLELKCRYFDFGVHKIALLIADGMLLVIITLNFKFVAESLCPALGTCQRPWWEYYRPQGSFLAGPAPTFEKYHHNVSELAIPI